MAATTKIGRTRTSVSALARVEMPQLNLVAVAIAVFGVDWVHGVFGKTRAQFFRPVTFS
jgi:hypothetical protein